MANRNTRPAPQRIANWDTWLMQPGYGPRGNAWGMPEPVYAPNLEHAFKLARSFWPTAQSWRCLGAVDPRDPEMVLS